MNREEIKAMAWAAGLIPDKEPVVYHSFLQESQIYKFAALVAAAERAACAKLCLETEPFYGVMFANAIRERSNT